MDQRGTLAVIEPAQRTTDRRLALPARIAEPGVIAIARRLDPAVVAGVADALIRGGVGAVEITLDTGTALASIRTLRDRFDESDLLIGAGTVLDAPSAEEAVRAGARFLVTPTFDERVVHAAVDLGVPILPGAFTPTEIHAAWRSGATAVKLFPASAVGPAFVSEMGGPFPEIPLVPTGGVTVEWAADFIIAGAAAVGMGGGLVGTGDPATVEERARYLVASIREARTARADRAARRAGVDRA
ncbi:MAG: bifunctional 4-hydroxy-2-oxoglutarate aldolase/2-dehydro-3-deoxy-phosphogluconate aldolase [Chloroflexi bacterium]|nr:MAG: bifunctional 4-hydroxy-2-oxoglutarate aldolase/2-dehydro-3-deoxy-phosphogluconate aldolase [Chloroflexota bacterium]